MILKQTIEWPGNPTDLLIEKLVSWLSSIQSVETTESEVIQAQDIADIKNINNGDQDNFERLILRHQADISRMMWRFSRDPMEHEELVQDVFVEAYTSLRTYKEKAPFSHWLSRIATRIGYRYWQRKQRDREAQTIPVDKLREVLADPLTESEPSEAAELLFSLFSLLGPRDRLILTLRYLEGLSVSETVARTGWSQTLVKVQANRAKARLKKQMEKLDRGERDA